MFVLCVCMCLCICAGVYVCKFNLDVLSIICGALWVVLLSKTVWLLNTWENPVKISSDAKLWVILHQIVEIKPLHKHLVIVKVKWLSQVKTEVRCQETRVVYQNFWMNQFTNNYLIKEANVGPRNKACDDTVRLSAAKDKNIFFPSMILWSLLSYTDTTWQNCLISSQTDHKNVNLAEFELILPWKKWSSQLDVLLVFVLLTSEMHTPTQLHTLSLQD